MKKTLRIYTKRRLKRNFPSKIFNNFFKRFSVSNLIIFLNVSIFFVVLFLSLIFGQEKIFSVLALRPSAIFSGNLWLLLTSLFLHANLMHLICNMISLFFIGNFVEKVIGRKRFFYFYLISGLFAGFFYSVLSFFFTKTPLGEKLFSNPLTFAMGASGAIFALLGLLAILTPKNKVYLICGPLIAIILESILLGVFPGVSFIKTLNFLITIYLFISIFAIFSFNPKIRKLAIPLKLSFWVLPLIAIIPLSIIGLFVELPIGNSAHLGGLLIGLGYGIYLKRKYKRKINLLNKFFQKK